MGIISYFKDCYDKSLKATEGYESVDISLGHLNVDQINERAWAIAKEKEWISLSSDIRTEIYLMQSDYSSKLLWGVYFVHYCSEDERKIQPDLISIRFAVVRFDDETGEVVFADYLKRLQLTTKWMISDFRENE